MAEKASRLSEDSRNKLVSLFLCTLGHLLLGEKEKAYNEIGELVDLSNKQAALKEQGTRVVDYDFSLLESLVRKKLRGGDRQKMLSVIANLKGNHEWHACSDYPCYR